MQVTIDQTGRIVVPKAVRERFGLRKDSELELEVTAEGIMLKPVEHEPLWRRENGRLVFIGRPAGKVNSDRMVHEDREARMRKIGGW
ncbi:MAG: AbrB/MazE/SpoVT family DNA-binding domain-containing protein [Silvibacterium sp.]|jgi:AbrB family looped-hinge helix DNA binding protein